MPQVSVKWQGKKFDVDVNTELEPLVFKSQLFELTNVLPERQKIVFKGKTIKDDTWDGIQLTDGALMMMLGSVEALLETPKFTDAEESTSQQGGNKAVAVKMPCGLENLGNSCYMNSVYQSFRAIPELVDGIKQWTSSGPSKAQLHMKPFLGAIHTLFADLSTQSRDSYTPLLQFKLMHQLYPQFAVRDQQHGGGYQQQDANELFTELIREFSNVSETEVEINGEKQKVPVRSFIEGLYDVRMKNTEDPDEPAQESKETFMQLSCFPSADTRYVQSGILSALTEEIEKHSPKLNRNCKYQKETRISRLPANLVIQMVRFFYKEKEQVNAKVLKDIKFPMIMDVFDFCTPELQAKLRPQRELHKEFEDKNMEKQRLAKLEDKKVEEKEHTKFHPTAFSDDPGSNNSGFYELKAIITHKGRASNSGHYIAWVRVKGTAWACCDDDSTYPVTEEEILKLSGGGDWHTAYILIYGPRPTPIVD